MQANRIKSGYFFVIVNDKKYDRIKINIMQNVMGHSPDLRI